MHIYQPKFILRLLFPAIYRIPQEEPTIYLTFDDGLCPETTPQILETLRLHGVKATFFCVGNNVKNNYQLFEQILNEGHQVGNHTMRHTDAWIIKAEQLIECVTEAAVYIQSKLFRPPHGHLTPRQAYMLRQRGYKIVLWDVICYDWDKKRSPRDIFNSIRHYTRNGSVIVLHDSVKAAPRVIPILDQIIAWLKSKGYKFDTLK